MADDRDKYRPRAKSPPLKSMVPQDEFEHEEPSAVRNAPTPLERIDARTRHMASETQASVLTLQGVRREFKEDIAEVRRDIGGIKSEIRGMNATQTTMLTTVGEMRGEIGEVSGQLKALPTTMQALTDERKALMADLADERRKAREEQHLTFKAQIDVDRHAKLAEIDDTTSRKKARREWITKALAIVGPLLAIALAIMQARGCASKSEGSGEEPALHVPATVP